MSSAIALAFEFHESLAPALAEWLRSVLPSERGTPAQTVLLVRAEQATEVAGARQTVVGLFDGKLNAEHAALLRCAPPTLLLACRGPSGRPAQWEIDLLLASLRGSGTQTPGFQMTLHQVGDLQLASRRAAELARASGAPQSAVDIVADVMHELAANALLDAPAVKGAPKYAHQRGAQVTIDAEDACEVEATLRDGRAFLSARDHFGRLSVSPVAVAVEGLHDRATVNTAGGGGGLGFRRIVEHSDALAVRVQPGALSEVTSAVDLTHARRRRSNPKSLFFFKSGG